MRRLQLSRSLRPGTRQAKTPKQIRLGTRALADRCLQAASLRSCYLNCQGEENPGCGWWLGGITDQERRKAANHKVMGGVGVLGTGNKPKWLQLRSLIREENSRS